jgi:amino acid transporter
MNARETRWVADTDRDAHDLAGFGYRQQLRRQLRFFSSFAAAFSYISPATGIFTLFALGIGTLGGAFFWTWPAVFIGQLTVALVFAEVSTHFPLAGSVFQWTKYLAKSKSFAWFSGWIYLWAGALTVTAVVATLPLTLIPLLDRLGIGIHVNASSLGAQQAIAFIVLAVITVLNVFGVRVVALINNTGVIFELLGLFVFAVLLAIFHHHHGLGELVHSGGASFTPGNFLIAAFMGLFVIYGFDTASTLAEETKNPRIHAPRAVVTSICAAFVIGTVFIISMIVAVPGSISKVIGAGISPSSIIDANLPNALSVAYLFVVSSAIFVCCLTIQAATIRLAFGMARDRQLPGSQLIRSVSSRTATPIAASLLVCGMAGIFLIQYAGAGFIAIAASGLIYVAYLMANLAILAARRRGWPEHAGAFSLGRWGPVVNIAAIAWGAGMLVNFAWHRAATNPAPDETGHALSLGLTILNRIPVLWTVFGAVMLVGAGYYLTRRPRIPAPLADRPPGEDSDGTNDGVTTQ